MPIDDAVPCSGLSLLAAHTACGQSFFCGSVWEDIAAFLPDETQE